MSNNDNVIQLDKYINNNHDNLDSILDIAIYNNDEEEITKALNDMFESYLEK